MPLSSLNVPSSMTLPDDGRLDSILLNCIRIMGISFARYVGGTAMADNEEESKGVRISQPRIRKKRNNHKRDAAAALDEFRKLSSSNALAELAKSASSVAMVQDAMANLPDFSRARLMEVHRGAAQAFAEARHLVFSKLPEVYLDTVIPFDPRIETQFKEIMAAHTNMMSQHTEIYADIQRSLKNSALLDMANLLNTSQILATFKMLRESHLSSAIEQANYELGLGFSDTFHKEIKTVIDSMAEHTLDVARVPNIAPATGLRFDISETLASLLARSLVVQESILIEQQKLAKGTKEEALSNRRYATASVIMQFLMLLLVLLTQVEERFFSDDGADIRANTKALSDMRESIDTMASEFDEMREAQEAHAERQNAADAQIVEILREISSALSDKADIESDDEADERELDED